MPNLLVKPKGDQGRVTHVTPESAGWTYVGFDLHRVKAGETISAPASDRESCLVWISGKSETSVDGQDFGVVGERMSPFEGAPHALYVAPGSPSVPRREAAISRPSSFLPVHIRCFIAARDRIRDALPISCRKTTIPPILFWWSR
jgi:hypothetical protein